LQLWFYLDATLCQQGGQLFPILGLDLHQNPLGVGQEWLQ